VSYLAWPVCVNGRICDLQGRPLHITCKYFGMVPITKDEIKERLRGIDTGPITAMDNPHWAPAFWGDAELGDGIHVLQIVNPPKRMIQAHEAFDDILPESFGKYRPHITLSKPFWDFARSFPGSTLIECGPLMLMGLDK
jgi:hypothetical protein